MDGSDRALDGEQFSEAVCTRWNVLVSMNTVTASSSGTLLAAGWPRALMDYFLEQNQSTREDTQVLRYSNRFSLD